MTDVWCLRAKRSRMSDVRGPRSKRSLKADVWRLSYFSFSSWSNFLQRETMRGLISDVWCRRLNDVGCPMSKRSLKAEGWWLNEGWGLKADVWRLNEGWGLKADVWIPNPLANCCGNVLKPLREWASIARKWGNRLSFHNSLSISGGKKVENLWEIFPQVTARRPREQRTRLVPWHHQHCRLAGAEP